MQYLKRTLLNRFAVLSIFTTILLFISSCKKETIFFDEVNVLKTQNEAIFFNKQNVTDSIVIKLINELSNKNINNPFVDRMIKEVGYPRWDKAISKKEFVSPSIVTIAANETNFVIPLVDVSNSFITGAIVVHVGAVTSFFVTELHDYRILNSDKNAYTKAMMWLDYKIFNHSHFKVQDNILFNGVKTVIFKKANSSIGGIQANSSIYDDCYEVEIWYNPNGDASNNDGDEYFTGETYWVGICDEDEVISIIIGGTGGAGYYELPTSPYHSPGGSGGTSPLPTPPYIPVPLALGEIVNYLTEQLNLTPSQQLLLQDNEIRAREMFSYLYGYYSNARVEILKTHLLYLIEYPDYLNFVGNHRAAFTGNLTMWWENDDWAQANLNQIPNIPFLYVDENMFDPTIDLQKFMNCFTQIPDAGATYQVKLSIDLPVNGLPLWPVNATEKSPGHTFLTLTKTNGTQSATQSVGYYPTDGATSPGVFKDNGDPVKGGHQYNASLILNNLSGANFNNIVQYLLAEQNTQYDVSTHNCTSVALGAFNQAVSPDVTIPPYIVTLPTIPPVTSAYLHSPQMLYKYIENFTPSATVTKQVNVKFKAPDSHGNCN